MEYSGSITRSRCRIKLNSKGWLEKYGGQECDVLLYDGDVMPQINTEQLKPPMPKWQSVSRDSIETIEGKYHG